MPNSRQFWRIVALIGLAHVVAVIGLVRWNARGKPPNPASIVWITGDSGGDVGPSTGAYGHVSTKASPPAAAEETAPAAKLPDNEDSIVLASAKSEIELPVATPTATPTPVGKPSAAPVFKGTKPGVAEENLQPRIRSTILHALSNKFGYIVLSTGNKSELATGYSTLYGDMAGGFAVLKDVLKTLVFELSRYRNNLSSEPVIPLSVLEKPPSAELRPGQKDVDSLPPYDVLDPILKAYVEDDRSFSEIIAMGFDKKTVERVMRLVDISEYKRRQAPPGVKITTRAFGRDRRLPITNKYRESV